MTRCAVCLATPCLSEAVNALVLAACDACVASCATWRFDHATCASSGIATRSSARGSGMAGWTARGSRPQPGLMSHRGAVRSGSAFRVRSGAEFAGKPRLWPVRRTNLCIAHPTRPHRSATLRVIYSSDHVRALLRDCASPMQECIPCLQFFSRCFERSPLGFTILV